MLEETITFDVQAPSAWQGGIKCDLAGNVYSVNGSPPLALTRKPGGFQNMSLRKFSVDSKSVLEFVVPSLPDYASVSRIDFDVTGRGQVYALLAARKPPTKEGERPEFVYLIAKYRDDGTVDSFITIRYGGASGKLIGPRRFAAFGDGTFLVTGMLYEPQEGAATVSAFTALFDRGGTFVKDIEMPDDVKPVKYDLTPNRPRPEAAPGRLAGSPTGSGPRANESHPSTNAARTNVHPTVALSNGMALSAPDGNVYILRGTEPPRVYVITPGGEVIRQFEVPAPERGLTPTQLAPAGADAIFIQFPRIGVAEHTPFRPITIVDAQDGRVIAVYRATPPERSFETPACAISPYDFLFIGSTQDQKLKVARYAAPGGH